MAGISEGVRLPPGKSKKDCDYLYENFVCMFGEAIEPDVILAVLESKNWNVEQAAEDLMKLQADFSEESKKVEMGSGSSSLKNEYSDNVDFAGNYLTNVQPTDSHPYNQSYAFDENWTRSFEPKHVGNDKNKDSTSHGSAYKFSDSWNEKPVLKSDFSSTNENKRLNFNDHKSAYTYNENWEKNLDLTKAVVDNKGRDCSDDEVNDIGGSDDCEDSDEEDDGFEGGDEKGTVKSGNQIDDNYDDDDADVIIEEEKEFVMKDDEPNNQLLMFNRSLPSQFQSLSLASNVSSPSYFDQQYSLPCVDKVLTGFIEVKSTRKTESKAKPAVKKPNKKLQDLFFINYNQAKTIKNDFDRIYTLAVNGVKIMVLMRGVPGSGKSHTADSLLKKLNKSGVYVNKLHNNAHIFSTDDFFASRGFYDFDVNKLPVAHEWNQKRVEKALSLHRSPIIVDNTNTQLWEMKSYVVLAVSCGYHIELLEPNTKWKYNENELRKRNTHGVSKKNIKIMLDRFAHDINGQKLLKELNVSYPPNLKPPQPLQHLKFFEETKEQTKRTRTRKKKQPVAMSNVIQTLPSCDTKVLNLCSSVKDDYNDVFQGNKMFNVINDNSVSTVPTSDSSAADLDCRTANTEYTNFSVKGNSEIVNAGSSLSSESQYHEFETCAANLGAVVNDYSHINELYRKLLDDVDNNPQESSKLLNFPQLDVKNDNKDVKENSKKTSSFSHGSLNKANCSNDEVYHDLRLEYVSPNNLFYENYDLAKTIKNDFERVSMLILNKVKVLVLLRGCPGSGKTYLAKQLMDRLNSFPLFINSLEYKYHVLSADDYFISSSGYFFDRHKLSEAFLWNENRGTLAMENCVSPVIIDNYNGEVSDMKPYVQAAVKYGYDVEILEPDTEWKFNEDELVKRNVHGVIRMKLRYLLDKYEKNLSAEVLLKKLDLDYSNGNKPPQAAYDTFKGYTAFKSCSLFNSHIFENYEVLTAKASSEVEIVNQPGNENDFFNNKEESMLNNQNSYKNINSEIELSIKQEQEENVSKNGEDIEKSETKFEHNDYSKISVSNELFPKNVDNIRFCPLFKSITNEFKNAFDRICILILCKVKVLVLLRGFYSTGKTYTAHNLIEKINNLRKSELLPLIYFEHVFNGDNKTYNYWEYLNQVNYPSIQNQERVEKAMKNNITPILIDNCNIKLSEMEPHVKMAVNYGYVVEILEPDTEWRFDEDELVKRNVFASTGEAQNWLRFYEKNVDGKKLLEYFNLRYNRSLLPQIDQNLYVSVLKLMYPIDQEFSSVKVEKSLEEGYDTSISKYESGDHENKKIFPSSDILISNDQPFPYDDIIVQDDGTHPVSSNFLFQTNISSSENILASNNNVRVPNTIACSLKDGFVCNTFGENNEETIASLNPSEDFSLINNSEYVLSSNLPASSKNVEKCDEPVGDNKFPSVNSCKDFVIVNSSESLLSTDGIALDVTINSDDQENTNGVNSLSENVQKCDEPVGDNKYPSVNSCKDFVIVNSSESLLSTDGIASAVMHKNDDVNSLSENFQQYEKPGDDSLSSVNTCKDFLLVNSSENILSTDEISSGVTIKNDGIENSHVGNMSPENVQKHDKPVGYDQLSLVNSSKDFHTVNSERLLSSDGIASALTIAQDDGGNTNDANDSSSSSNKGLVLIQDSDKSVSYETASSIPDPVKEEVPESKTDTIEEDPKHSLDSKITNVNDFADFSDKFENQGSDVETLKNSFTCVSDNEIENEGSENNSEVFLSDKLNDSFNSCQESSADNSMFYDTEDSSKEHMLTARQELKKINVIDWLTENKKPDSEVDTKNINKINSNDKHQTYEFSCSWKSWDTPEGLLEKKENVDHSLSKPPRSPEKQRKPVPSSNTVTGLPTKPKKIPKEFLNWSTIPDPQSDWFGRVKDTISGTSSNDPTPKPPRSLCNNDSKSTLDKICNIEEPTNFGAERESGLQSSAIVIPKQSNKNNVHDGLVTLLRDSASSCQSVIQNNEETDNVEEGGQKVDYSPDVLSNLFPHVASVYLKDLLEKCHGDINWAAEILLEESHDERTTGTFAEMRSLDSAQLPEPLQGDIPPDPETMNSNVNEFFPDLDQSAKKLKKGMFTKNKKPVKEDAIELKKAIEQNIVLNASSYSENILKLIKKRKGENLPDSGEEVPLESFQEGEEVPSSCSVSNNGAGDEEEFMSYRLDANEEEENAVGGSTGDEDEGSLEFTFSKDFVSKLHQNFGSSCLSQHMFERELNVELPKSLARQIHSYVMDSLQLQMDDEYYSIEKMIAEDEEFARRLQEIENGSQQKRNSTPNLQEIIDMETALAIYKSDLENDSEKRENNETFAARLGKSILLEKFPNIDQRALLELYSANRNSLHDTISALMLNQESEMNLNEWERQLLEKAQQESIKDNLESNEAAGYSGRSEVESQENSGRKEEAMSDWEYYREEAAKHRKERDDCFNKAKEAYTQGNKNAAAYYSQLANLHMQQIEQASNKAATALLTAHKASSEITLDLHFYQVKEALEVLDLFLDSSINRLKEKQRSNVMLFIITGRGLHSSNGKSKLKPVIMRRLKTRQISFTYVNPGMLQVIVTKSSPLSSSI